MSALLRRLKQAASAFTEVLLTPAEDPRPSASEAPSPQLLLDGVRQALRGVGQTRTQLTLAIEKVRRTLPRLESQSDGAQAARDAAQIDLSARQREAAQVQLRALERQVLDLDRVAQRLTLVEQRLATQLQNARLHQDLVAARCSAAQAQVRAAEALATVPHDLARSSAAVEEAERLADHYQAYAAALTSLVRDPPI